MTMPLYTLQNCVRALVSHSSEHKDLTRSIVWYRVTMTGGPESIYQEPADFGLLNPS